MLHANRKSIYSTYSDEETVIIPGEVWTIPGGFGRMYLVRKHDGEEKGFPTRYNTSGVECWLLTPMEFLEMD